MLIGIDMFGIQSPRSGDREAGRIGRQLLSALLAVDPSHRYVLYVHEGLPTDGIPSARNVLRVTLAEGPDGPTKIRPTIRRILDLNPDGLDWIVLLDPFESSCGGSPSESRLDGLKVASIITDLAPNRVDDRRLAPLRKHDAILAFSDPTADECRRRLPLAAGRIRRLGLACDLRPNDLDGDLERLGITAPFLFANMTSGVSRSNLGGVLEAYYQLAVEHRDSHQLVLAGEIEDPWAVVAQLHDRGCAEGLVLVGDVDEPTLRTLYGRCAAFISPSFEDASALSLVEAMNCGAPVIAGRAGIQPEVVDQAGLLADPYDPSEIAEVVSRLLSDAEFGRRLRQRARARARCFSWEPVARQVLDVLHGEDSTSPRPKVRFDQAHAVPPGNSLLEASSRVGSVKVDLDDWFART